ncbi:MAG: hypothetical protein ABIH23_35145 [bacterium]
MSGFMNLLLIFGAIWLPLMCGIPDLAGAQNLSEFSAEFFAGSGVCARCHTSLQDSAGNNVSIDADWRSTMMANSAKDPFFLAKVSSELARFPALKEVIENKCATCHMPMARTQATADGSPVSIFGEGFLDLNHELYHAARDGVSCTLCHQIMNIQLGEHESFSGKYVVDFIRQSPERWIHGPFPQPFTNNMRLNAGFTPVHAEHISEARLCSTCHVLYTPVIDESGSVVGEFPEQTVYLEWEHSDYGDPSGINRTCQDCHMPDAAGGVVLSQAPRNLSPRSPFGKHYFAGGNNFMLSILDRYAGDLEVTAGVGHFTATQDRTISQIQHNAATVDIEKAEINDGTLEAEIVIETKVGHKFPSGFPSRRLWVHLFVLNGNHTLIFESGLPSDDGSIVGNNADENPTLFESHFDVITQADQVQVYEAIMQDLRDAPTYALLLASSYAKDNRLLPIGFDKRSAATDIAVSGHAVDDINFVAGGDRILYRIDVSGHDGPFTVQAKLLYQTVSYSFMKDLEQEDTSQIVRMSQYFQSADPKYVEVGMARREEIYANTHIPTWKVR